VLRRPQERHRNSDSEFWREVHGLLPCFADPESDQLASAVSDLCYEMARGMNPEQTGAARPAPQDLAFVTGTLRATDTDA
jgi:hypothetical protein